MSDTMQIRGEQIQDNTITSRHIKDLDISKIYNNNIPLSEGLTQYISINLSKEQWSNKEYTINNDNIKITSNGQLLNSDLNNIEEIIKSNINIKNQLDRKIILSCDVVPNVDLQLILILN